VNLTTARIAPAPAVSAAGNSRLRVRVKRALTIKRDAAELYSFWLDTLNPQPEAEGGPSEPPLDAVVTKSIPGQLISWSIQDAETGPHTGTVRFEPAIGDQGTEVSVTLEYFSPGGKLADARVKFTSREAADRVVEALCSLKSVMETSEITASATPWTTQLSLDPLVTSMRAKISKIETPLSNMMEEMLPQWMRGGNSVAEH
jgi:uncharacterized membrane protein